MYPERLGAAFCSNSVHLPRKLRCRPVSLLASLLLMLNVCSVAFGEELKPIQLKRDAGIGFSERDINFYNLLFKSACSYFTKSGSDVKDLQNFADTMNGTRSPVHADYRFRVLSEAEKAKSFAAPDVVISNDFLTIGLGSYDVISTSFIRLRYKPSGFLAQETIESEITLRKDCSPDSHFKLFAFTEGRKISRIMTLDKDGKITEIKQLKPAALPLDIIYFPKDARKLDDVTVRVGIFDSGIDYNHPDLAFRIPRSFPKDEKSTGMCDRIIRLENEKKDLQALFSEKKISKADYESNLQKINTDLIQTKNHCSDFYDTRIEGFTLSTQDHLPYDVIPPPIVGSEDTDYANHGTHVAGIACQGTNFVEIVPLKLFPDRVSALRPQPSDEKLWAEKAKRMLDYAAEKRVRVINLSIGWENTEKDNVLGRVLRKFIQTHPDILFVFAAGNERQRLHILDDFGKKIILPYRLANGPASFYSPNVMLVAAVDDDNRLAPFSNYGKEIVHVAALGVKVNSCWPDCQYKTCSGTSMAAPQVTRLAARLLRLNPKLSPKEISEIICKTATPVKSLKDLIMCGGVVNEEAALKLAAKDFSPHNPATHK